jgi:hypothetical protein
VAAEGADAGEGAKSGPKPRSAVKRAVPKPPKV